MAGSTSSDKTTCGKSEQLTLMNLQTQLCKFEILRHYFLEVKLTIQLVADFFPSSPPIFAAFLHLVRTTLSAYFIFILCILTEWCLLALPQSSSPPSTTSPSSAYVSLSLRKYIVQFRNFAHINYRKQFILIFSGLT